MASYSLKNVSELRNVVERPGVGATCSIVLVGRRRPVLVKTLVRSGERKAAVVLFPSQSGTKTLVESHEKSLGLDRYQLLKKGEVW